MCHPQLLKLQFKEKPRDEQAEVADTADGERVGHLLGLNVKDFLNSLIKPKVKVGTEYINKGQSVVQVLYAVTALCKAMFERMFFWIIERVNTAFDTKKRRSYFIGVLDIAGFEIFEYNSFDQIDGPGQVHTEINGLPLDAFLLVFLLFQNEHVVVV